MHDVLRNHTETKDLGVEGSWLTRAVLGGSGEQAPSTARGWFPAPAVGAERRTAPLGSARWRLPEVLGALTHGDRGTGFQSQERLALVCLLIINTAT